MRNWIGQAAHAPTCNATKVLVRGERNWERGLSWTETVDSLRRHLAAFMQGEDVDVESGLPHVHHLQCNAMMLAHFFETATEPPRPRDVGISGLRLRAPGFVPTRGEP